MIYERVYETFEQMLEYEAIQKGFKQGKLEGREEGREEGHLLALREVLLERLGQLRCTRPDVLNQIANADARQIQSWIYALLDGDEPERIFRLH